MIGRHGGLTPIEPRARAHPRALPATRGRARAARRGPGPSLAEPVTAAERVPGFDNSAMDGFAFRHADLPTAPVLLRLAVGESRAGHPCEGTVGAGEAIAISTGAVLPEGADTVVRVEDTARARAGLRRGRGRARTGANVRRRRRGHRARSRAARRRHPPRRRRARGARLGRRRHRACARRPRVALLLHRRRARRRRRAAARRAGSATRTPTRCRRSSRPPAASWSRTTRPRRSRERPARRSQRGSPGPTCSSSAAGVSVGPHDHVKPAFAAARRRAGLLARLAEARQAHLLRRRSGRRPGASGCPATRSRPSSPFCSSPARRSSPCRAPTPRRAGSRPS